ncbi:MAG: C_GCAxxG_C_C family protein [Acidobacteria bacterium]|nr:C_GCAxxG_C_C family protein [Acidobacteriota bacterium]
MNKVEHAEKYFADGGYACSQSVFAAFADSMGLDVETALKIAAPFGGGIARNAGICGAVTGAIMAIGLKYGNYTQGDDEAKSLTYEKVNLFLKKFKEKYGTSICKELLGHDISTPEGLEYVNSHPEFHEKCTAIVKETAEILEEII